MLGIGILPSDPGTVDQTKVSLLELRALGEHDSSLRAMVLARRYWELHWSEAISAGNRSVAVALKSPAG